MARGVISSEQRAKNARCAGVSSAIVLFVAFAGLLCITAGLLTPCWVSRSYLLFNTGADKAPDITVCFGLDSYQISTANTAAPTVRTFYVSELTDRIFNLKTFADNSKATRAALITANTFAHLAVAGLVAATSAWGGGARKGITKAASLVGLVAGVAVVVASAVWAARVPDHHSWLQSGGIAVDGFDTRVPWYSYYFTNAAYSIALAILGGSLLIVAAVVAPLAAAVHARNTGSGAASGDGSSVPLVMEGGGGAVHAVSTAGVH